MRSKNHKRITHAESAHLVRVKALGCSICDAPGPSDAHHIEQGKHFTCIALCKSCHQGQILGLHGQRRMWHLKKMTELDALAVTIERLMEQAYA